MSKRSPARPRPRRQKGSGSYRWRSHGAVELSVYDPETKRPRTRNAKAVDDEDARRQLALFLAEVLEGKIPGGKARTTVAQVAAEWLRRKERSGSVSNATLAENERALNRHVLPELGDKPIRKVTALDLEAHYAALQFPCRHRGGLSPKSIAYVAAVVFQVIEYARRADFVSVNVARDVVERPKPNDEKDFPVPDDEQVQRFLKAAQDHDFTTYAFVVLTVSTGARRGEILALRRRDLLVDEGVVWIRGAVSTKRRRVDSRGRAVPGPNVFVKETKTSAGRRRVSIGDGAIAVVSEYLRRLDKIGEQHGLEHYPDDGFLFSSDLLGSRPWNPRTVGARFAKVGKEAGVKIAPHAFRHYAATVLAPTMPESEIMGRFGWRSVTMVRRYAEYKALRDREAGGHMDRALRLVVDGEATEPSTA